MKDHRVPGKTCDTVHAQMPSLLDPLGLRGHLWTPLISTGFLFPRDRRLSCCTLPISHLSAPSSPHSKTHDRQEPTRACHGLPLQTPLEPRAAPAWASAHQEPMELHTILCISGVLSFHFFKDTCFGWGLRVEGGVSGDDK